MMNSEVKTINKLCLSHAKRLIECGEDWSVHAEREFGLKKKLLTAISEVDYSDFESRSPQAAVMFKLRYDKLMTLVHQLESGFNFEGMHTNLSREVSNALLMYVGGFMRCLAINKHEACVRFHIPQDVGSFLATIDSAVLMNAVLASNLTFQTTHTFESEFLRSSKHSRYRGALKDLSVYLNLNNVALS